MEPQGPHVSAGQHWCLSPEGENSCKKENQKRFTLLRDHFSIQGILSAWDTPFSTHTSQEKKSQLEIFPKQRQGLELLIEDLSDQGVNETAQVAGKAKCHFHVSWLLPFGFFRKPTLRQKVECEYLLKTSLGSTHGRKGNKQEWMEGDGKQCHSLNNLSLHSLGTLGLNWTLRVVLH